MNNKDFVLPLTKDLLKYHTRWNERSLKPYTDELFDLWAENGIDGLLDTQLQGPTLTRFGIIPDDRRSADRIIGLLPTYKAIFNRNDVQVYRADGHIYIDVPWQTDQVYLGDILTDGEFDRELSTPQGIPIAIGMENRSICIHIFPSVISRSRRATPSPPCRFLNQYIVRRDTEDSCVQILPTGILCLIQNCIS